MAKKLTRWLEAHVSTRSMQSYILTCYVLIRKKEPLIALGFYHVGWGWRGGCRGEGQKGGR